MTRSVGFVLLAFACAASSALAQPAVPSAVVSVGGGWQASDRVFADSFTFEQYVENATTNVDYTVKSGPVYDGAFGVRLWRALGVGVAFSRFKSATTAGVAADIPHPFFYNTIRRIQGEATGVSRQETAVHAQLLALVPAGSRVLLVLAAGPTFWTIKQDLVSAVRFDEAYPYDAATFRLAGQTTDTEKQMGFNASADVIFRLGGHFGLAALARYTQATVDLAPGDRRISVHVGGLQAGAGVRVMF